METIKATIVKPNQAIKLRARKECIDRDGHARVTGEEWLVKKTGAYLPGAYEEVVDTVQAYVLTEKVAVTLCQAFTCRHIVNQCPQVVGIINKGILF
jgi:major vault protein